jgi:hypothetical protein
LCAFEFAVARPSHRSIHSFSVLHIALTAAIAGACPHGQAFAGDRGITYSIVDGFDVGVSTPSGLCFDGQSFRIANYGGNPYPYGEWIYSFNGRTHKLTDSVHSPDTFPTGLTWDGHNLWVIDNYPIFHMSAVKMSPSGPVLGWIPFPLANDPGGLGADGTNLYYGLNPIWDNPPGQAAKVYKVDSANGALLDSITLPSSSVSGLFYDRGTFWYCDNGTQGIFHIDRNGNTLWSSRSPGPMPAGITIAQGYLWCLDGALHRVYQFDIGIAPPIPPNFSAESQRSNVLLTWGQSTSPAVRQYRIYRGISSDFFTAACIDSVNNSENSFADRGAQSGYEYFYWVTSVDSSGLESHPSITAMVLADEPLPGETTLYQNYPNPFNPGTLITYDLSVTTHVRLTVFDLTGRKVRTLVDGPELAGRRSVEFKADGLSSGVYFYRLEAAAYTGVKMFMLLK